MEWQAIANFTNTMDNSIKKVIEDKRHKDALVEIPNIWSDFVISTSSMLDEAQNHLEVTSDGQGMSNCLTKFPETHTDYKDSGKVFSQYVIEKFDNNSSLLLENVKNPISRQGLQARISGYKENLSQHLVKTEAKLVHDKRYTSAIESMEKLSRATYLTPNLLEYNLTAISDSINSLAILPQAKDKLIHTAKTQFAHSAALNELHNNPNIILQANIDTGWKKHLPPQQIAKYEDQARSILGQRQRLIEKDVKQTFKKHIERIKKKGEGIIAFDELARSSFGADHPEYMRMKSEEALTHAAFDGMQKLKYLPFEQGEELVKSYKPLDDDPLVLEKDAIHQKMRESLKKQIKDADEDPAAFCEDLFADELEAISSDYKKLRYIKNLQIDKNIDNPRYLSKAKRNRILAKLQIDDPAILNGEINKILSLGQPENPIGLDVLEEVLKDSRKLKAPIYFYAKSKMLNQDIADDFASMIPRSKELFSMQTDQQKSALKREINGYSTFKAWRKKMILHQPYNIEEVNTMFEGVRHLARYYQMTDRASSNNAAVEMAAEKLITDCYATELDGGFGIPKITSKKIGNESSLQNLMLPKQIVQDGGVHDINPEIVKEKLLEIRKGIISGEIEFDVNNSFENTTAARSQHREESIKKLLNEGSFFLSRDGKTLHFCVLDQGEYYPIRKNKNYRLEFNLIDL